MTPREYTLETNDGPNHLHGGVRGLDKVALQIESIEDGTGDILGFRRRASIPARCIVTSSNTAFRPHHD